MRTAIFGAVLTVTISVSALARELVVDATGDTGNSAEADRGGGVRCNGFGKPEFTNCTIAENVGHATAASRRQSSMPSLISSELPFSSGAYIAYATVGSALNLPGISARTRYATLCLPRARRRTKRLTRSSRNST